MKEGARAEKKPDLDLHVNHLVLFLEFNFDGDNDPAFRVFTILFVSSDFATTESVAGFFREPIALLSLEKDKTPAPMDRVALRRSSLIDRRPASELLEPVLRHNHSPVVVTNCLVSFRNKNRVPSVGNAGP